MDEHSDDELGIAFSALDYEIDAFLRDSAALRNGSRDHAWGNEILEAYLVHGRILASFLGATSPHRDDITPKDFGIDWTWPSTAEAKVVVEHVKAINKHLAHLSWERAAHRDGVWWDLTELPRFLIPIFRDFVDELESVHPNYAAILRARVEAG